ncbi:MULTISPECIES: hypothetical protein [Bizionia]|uniref:Uncharacterized protein n=1 Tax=Bizionia algoritergicola TaxID=291187 RepID=A0A5D0R0R6_9FLAO|nr:MULTISPECIES: hypothetical protein [Bizionia]TYB74565.1 hypothetical protein ES675_00015 [Bizionia algoritergicola]
MKLSNKVTPSLKELTEVSNYSNTAVVKHYAGMNLRVAINSNGKSMAMMTKVEGGEELVKKCVTNMLIGTSMYFAKVLPDRQANVVAEELLANYEYRQLKLEDVLAICYEIKEADIINLTPARILKHIKDYFQRREQAIIDQSINASETNKNGNFDADFDKRIRQSARHLDDQNKAIVRTRTSTRKFYK